MSRLNAAKMKQSPGSNVRIRRPGDGRSLAFAVDDRLAAIKRGLPLCREGFLQLFRQPLGHAACRWKCGNEAGLQGVVDVDLAEKRIRLWFQRLVDLSAPATIVMIDEISRNKAPDPPVPH